MPHAPICIYCQAVSKMKKIKRIHVDLAITYVGRIRGRRRPRSVRFAVLPLLLVELVAVGYPTVSSRQIFIVREEGGRRGDRGTGLHVDGKNETGRCRCRRGIVRRWRRRSKRYVMDVEAALRRIRLAHVGVLAEREATVLPRRRSLETIGDIAHKKCLIRVGRDEMLSAWKFQSNWWEKGTLMLLNFNNVDSHLRILHVISIADIFLS